MPRVKKIIMVCVIISISAFVTASIFSILFGGEDSEFTDYFNNHPAKELLEENNYCKTRASQITESVYYASFSVHTDLKAEQLLQIAEYEELSISGKCYKKSDGTGLDVIKSSFVFYNGDTDELIDAFIWENGERRDFKEKEVYLPAYMNDDYYTDDEAYE